MSTLPQSGGSYTLQRGKLQKTKAATPQPTEPVEAPALPTEELTETKETDNGK